MPTTRFHTPCFVIHTQHRDGHTTSEFAYTRGAADQIAAESNCATGLGRVAVRPYAGDIPARLVAAHDLWTDAIRYGRLARQAELDGDVEWAELYRAERLALLARCGRMRREAQDELETAARRVFAWV